MSKKNLWQLYNEHTGYASHKWSLYLIEYERLFRDLRDKPVRLLEIGVHNGGSLDIWSQYFESALALVGCDINPECVNLSYQDPRVNIVIGDINEIETRNKILSYCPELDIIIDDGSHCSGDIINSFIRYFPHVAPGGLFIIEDLHCSYWEQFQGGLFHPYSSISFFKRLIDIINYDHWGVVRSQNHVLSGVLAQYNCVATDVDLSQVHSVEFIDSMCVVRKAIGTKHKLGYHIVKGDFEKISTGDLRLDGIQYEFDPNLSQMNNSYSTLAMPPEELLFLTEKAYSESKQQLAELRDEIDGLRNSKSWRLTAPLRWAVQTARIIKDKIVNRVRINDQDQ